MFLLILGAQFKTSRIHFFLEHLALYNTSYVLKDGPYWLLLQLSGLSSSMNQTQKSQVGNQKNEAHRNPAFCTSSPVPKDGTSMTLWQQYVLPGMTPSTHLHVLTCGTIPGQGGLLYSVLLLLLSRPQYPTCLASSPEMSHECISRFGARLQKLVVLACARVSQHPSCTVQYSTEVPSAACRLVWNLDLQGSTQQLFSLAAIPCFTYHMISSFLLKWQVSSTTQPNTQSILCTNLDMGPVEIRILICIKDCITLHMQKG